MANLNNETSNKLNGNSEFKNKIQGAEHSIEKLAASTGEKIGTMASDFANTTAESMKTSREYVKENPVKGVAMAAAAGVVAGSLLTLALRSRRE